MDTKMLKKFNLEKYTKGYLAMIASVVCFALVGTIGLLIFEKGGTPITLLTGRALVASIVFGIMVLLFKQTFKIRKKDLGLLFIGSLFLTFLLLCYWQGLKTLGHIGVHNSLFLLHPIIMVIVASIFLKEKITKRKVLSLILGFLGILFVLKIAPSFQLNNFQFSILGIILSISAGLLMAGFMFVSQKLLKSYHFSQLLFYNWLIALGIFICLQKPDLTYNQLSTPFILSSVIFLGIFSTCLSYSFQQMAVKRIGAATSATVKLTKPALSIIFAFLILGQIMTFFQVVGVLSIMFGVYLIRKQ